MKSETYYIIQIVGANFLHGDRSGGYSVGDGRDAAAHLDISEARRVLRQLREVCGGDTPRRFPRILKVTTEIKPFKDRR